MASDLTRTSGWRSCSMRRLNTLALKKPGLDFVRSCLAREPSLAGRLNALDLLSAGEVFAVLPDDTPYERALQFEYGGLSFEGLDTEDLPEDPRLYWMADHLNAYLASNPGATIFMQD